MGELKMPELESEAEERAFWEIHDSSDYVDWSRAKPTSLAKLKRQGRYPLRPAKLRTPS